jgi:26S proteasome regulatory subunit N2
MLLLCRLIATTGRQNRGIDTAHAKSKGIFVSGTSGHAAGETTLEHIWALILASVRHVVQEDMNTKSRSPQWQSVIPTALAGKTLGLIGLGRLGNQVAQVCIYLHRQL